MNTRQDSEDAEMMIINQHMSKQQKTGRRQVDPADEKAAPSLLTPYQVALGGSLVWKSQCEMLRRLSDGDVIDTICVTRPVSNPVFINMDLADQFEEDIDQVVRFTKGKPDMACTSISATVAADGSAPVFKLKPNTSLKWIAREIAGRGKRAKMSIADWDTVRCASAQAVQQWSDGIPVHVGHFALRPFVAAGVVLVANRRYEHDHFVKLDQQLARPVVAELVADWVELQTAGAVPAACTDGAAVAVPVLSFQEALELMIASGAGESMDCDTDIEEAEEQVHAHAQESGAPLGSDSRTATANMTRSAFGRVRSLSARLGLDSAEESGDSSSDMD